jgi:outer membrane protein TolC
LLFVLLVLASLGLFFHDRQQTDALNKALDENTQLKQQVEEARKAPPLGNQGSQAFTPSSSNGPGLNNQNSWMLHGSGPLDRGAYKDGQSH